MDLPLYIMLALQVEVKRRSSSEFPYDLLSSVKTFEEVLGFIKDAFPIGQTLPNSYYKAK